MSLAAGAVTAQGFVDATSAAGISVPPNASFYLGRGACFGDFDGDGDQDLVVPGGSGALTSYWQNQGNGTFLDASLAANFGPSLIRPHACIAADVDNDGDLDVLMAGHFEPNRLYINDGNASFTEEGVVRGLSPMLTSAFSASFGDYDRDGWIDLYIGNYAAGGSSVGEANQLFRNLGNGFFQDVTASAGVGDVGLCFTGVFHDYDDDGWPDIFVGNDKGWYPNLAPDTTYRNNGDGTFTDVGAAIGTQIGIGAMGSDFTDAFNDGGWDIFVSNTSVGHVFHVWDPTTQTYVDQASTYGVIANLEGWATNFLDYDNDGWQDLYVVHPFVPNALFRNPGAAGGPWSDQAAAVGADLPSSTKYTASVADYDNDGRMDILCPRPSAPGVLFRNTVSAGNWIRLRLEGTVSNRTGIGAKVSVTIGTETQRQTLRTGHGYLGGHDLRLHYGAGTATTVDRVWIEWPSGQTQTLFGLATNTEHLIVEPRLSVTGSPQPGAMISLDLASPNEPARAYTLGLSGGNGGFAIPDGRVVPLDFDWLLALSTTPGNGLITPVGTLGGAGLGSVSLGIPAVPSLTGLDFYAAAVLSDASASFGIATIVGATTITVQ